MIFRNFEILTILILGRNQSTNPIDLNRKHLPSKNNNLK